MPELWARIHPMNKKRGYLKRRYHHKDQLYQGGEKPHWYKVDKTKALELSELRQDYANPHSAPLFQIVTDAEKDAMDKVEMDRRMAGLGLIAADNITPILAQPHEVDLTTADLPTGGREAAVPPAEAAKEVEPTPRKTSAVRTVLDRLGEFKKSTPKTKTSFGA